jgi:uncharacterized protein (DUF433 family)
MNPTIRNHRKRCVEILKAIDQGLRSVDAIAATLPQHTAQEIRLAIRTMRKRCDHIETVRRAGNGHHAIYRLSVPIEEAVAAIDPPPPSSKRIEYRSLQDALGMPADVRLTLDAVAKPRKVRPMGAWEVPA